MVSIFIVVVSLPVRLGRIGAKTDILPICVL